MNLLRSIINKTNVLEINRPLNILTFATHEGYQTLLDRTGHNFYMINRGTNHKRWDTSYRPIPPNHYEIDFWYDDLEIDFILSQDRFTQLQYSNDLSIKTRVPIVHLEHVEPQLDRWSDQQFENLKALKADINIFITEHNKNAWGAENGRVIPHGIDTEFFTGWNPNKENKYVLYVCNFLKERDYFCGYKVWNEVRHKVQEIRPDIEFRLVGHNGDMGKPAKNTEELLKQYQGCICYLNTSQLSPIPMSLLEAASVGCPIVSTAKQEIPKVFSNGSYSEISNNIDNLVSGVIKFCDNNFSGNGKKPQEIVTQNFSLKNFINNWNEVFTQAYKIKLSKAVVPC